jgi:hypothetical protein
LEQDSNIVITLIDEKTNQYFEKKVEMELKKSIKERKRLLNQLTEPEKTDRQEQILKEIESNLQNEDKLKELKAKLPADIIVFHGIKVRNAKSKMNTHWLRSNNLVAIPCTFPFIFSKYKRMKSFRMVVGIKVRFYLSFFR